MAVIKKYGRFCLATTMALIIGLSAFYLPTNASGVKSTGKYEGLMLTPGGMTFGVQLRTKGVLVIGTPDIKTSSGTASPARDAGILAGDIIYEVNGRQVNTTEEVVSAVEDSKGGELRLSVLSGGKKSTLGLKPTVGTDGRLKAGVAVRDSTAGIGTVTFTDNKSGAFAGLGHGICDADTGTLMPLLRASVSGVTISGIRKGKQGKPGEIKGYFNRDINGALVGNTETGVYGILSEMPEVSPKREPVPVGSADDVSPGRAYIYSTVENGKTEKYEIEIVRITDKKRDSKNFIIELTDERLLGRTGGIIQGMSGSPIIQNGKLVGAVTHVLIGEPERGYGIFIENMLDNISIGLGDKSSASPYLGAA